MRTVLMVAYAVSMAVAVVGHGMLPEQAAVHFGASGAADGWAPRAVHTGLFVVMNTVVFVLFLLGPRLAFRLPDDMISLPNRDYWLAEGRRDRALGIMSSLVHEFGATTLAFTVLVMVLTIQANHRQPPALDDTTFLVGLGAYLLYAAWWCIRLVRSFRKPDPEETATPIRPR